MEKLGVAVAIITDQVKEDIEQIVMSDDGSGGGIQIPSMLISNRDGNKLINFVRRQSDKEDSQAALIASFNIDHPDDRVEYDLWYTSSNDRALDFISEFQEID